MEDWSGVIRENCWMLTGGIYVGESISIFLAGNRLYGWYTLGNDRTPKIEVRPDGRTSSLWVRPDAGPDRTGSSGRTYRRTVTGPITEPRPDRQTGPTSDDVLEWFP